jgi:hypothetical protein
MENWILQTLISTGGGIIAGILIERRKRKWELEKEAMKGHFEDIKKCLAHIQERVSELRFYFISDEAFSIRALQFIEEELQDEMRFSDRLKADVPGFSGHLLELPSFLQHSEWCPRG